MNAGQAFARRMYEAARPRSPQWADAGVDQRKRWERIAQATLRDLGLDADGWELILSGLEALADQAEFDADHGGSDEPDVPRRIAADARDLACRLRRAGVAP